MTCPPPTHTQKKGEKKASFIKAEVEKKKKVYTSIINTAWGED